MLGTKKTKEKSTLESFLSVISNSFSFFEENHKK